MAENLLSSAASAVTGELTRVLFSGLMGKLDRKKQAAATAADKKLRRLDMLLIKINSAVEASEKHAAIENASLVTWRDRLKEAAAEGGEVLASFRQRETEAATAQARQATGDGDGDDDAQQHQQQEDPSSSSSSSSTALATTAIAAGSSNAPSGMAQGIFSATNLFSSEEDMERLSNAVERLEDISGDIRVFIKLLKLEILGSERPRKKLIPAPARAPAPAPIFTEDSGILKKSMNPTPARSNTGEGPPFDSRMWALPEPAAWAGQIQMDRNRTAAAAGQPPGEGSTLLGRLEEAVAAICWIVELADGRDLSGYEWLARWASVLREAKWQGCAVLGAISTVAVDAGAGGDEVEVARCDDQESFDELGRFVPDMESLAREAGSFSDLAYLCPTARHNALLFAI